MSDSNDPRVIFAGERTLLAWKRTCISLMAFGFVIERFALFLQLAGREKINVFQRNISFFVGIAFVLLASFLALYSVVQHRRILRILRPVEILEGYNLHIGMLVNGFIRFLGILLGAYLFLGFL